MTFPVSILAIDREVFVGEAESLTLPGQAGEFQILADHASLIARLKQGNLVIEKQDHSKETFSIVGGTVEVNEKEVTVLADF